MRWHVYRVNGCCSSYYDVRRRRPRPGLGGGLRCRECRRIMGWMQYDYVGAVDADSEFEAIRKAREHRLVWPIAKERKP